ncbi:MAG: hypothetical protein EBS21_11490 [Sphingomonadaceae bacterium]|nr:hypothetical protein [Sphingomonadaceae bacterium]
MQNPGLQPRASRELLSEDRSRNDLTTPGLRAQMLVCRYGLPLSIASHVASLCFGEGCND